MCFNGWFWDLRESDQWDENHELRPRISFVDVSGCLISLILLTPRVGLATCLRKEPSGSFNVSNHWICEPCKSQMRVKKSQDEILEPVGTSRGLEIDSVDWLRDVPLTRTLAKAVVAKLHFHLFDYIIREKGKSYTCNLEVFLNSVSHPKRRQKRWKMKLKLCSSVSLSYTE